MSAACTRPGDNRKLAEEWTFRYLGARQSGEAASDRGTGIREAVDDEVSARVPTPGRPPFAWAGNARTPRRNLRHGLPDTSKPR